MTKQPELSSGRLTHHEYTMSETPKAWSYSALTSFETCPRRHYEIKVAKSVTEPESEQLRWGNQVHKALELRAKDNKPLPTGMDQWEGLMAKLVAAPGWTMTESQFALTKDFKSTHWFSQDVWLRCIVDFGKLNGLSVLALDYKTGKIKHDMDQLKLFAAVLMKVYPEIQKVVTGYVWLKDKKVTKEIFTRAQEADIWNAFIPRVSRLQQAHETDKWPEKPSGLCRAWCPVTACQFNGKR